MDRARSLNLEHVSPLLWNGSGDFATPGLARGDEGDRMAYLRRWFFARKPDAGFVLTDFPATLLQAKVFDEWLDARNERCRALSPVQGPRAGRRTLFLARISDGGRGPRARMTIPIKNREGIVRMREACAIAATVYWKTSSRSCGRA
jgi:hypothetical protein